jgi:hypothetical protein
MGPSPPFPRERTPCPPKGNDRLALVLVALPQRCSAFQPPVDSRGSTRRTSRSTAAIIAQNPPRAWSALRNLGQFPYRRLADPHPERASSPNPPAIGYSGYEHHSRNPVGPVPVAARPSPKGDTTESEWRHCGLQEHAGNEEQEGGGARAQRRGGERAISRPGARGAGGVCRAVNRSIGRRHVGRTGAKKGEGFLPTE